MNTYETIIKSEQIKKQIQKYKTLHKLSKELLSNDNNKYKQFIVEREIERYIKENDITDITTIKVSDIEFILELQTIKNMFKNIDSYDPANSPQKIKQKLNRLDKLIEFYEEIEERLEVECLIKHSTFKNKYLKKFLIN